MRIDSNNATGGSAGTGRVEDSQSGQVRSASKPAANQPNDTVQLSSGHQTVRQLVAQLAQVADIRQEQVSALRSAIRSGEYQPANGEVAGAIAAQSFGIDQRA